MNMLSPAPYLRQVNQDPRAKFNCPKCETDFIAEEGVIYAAHYQRGEQVFHGLLTFCTAICLLQWEGIDHGNA